MPQTGEDRIGVLYVVFELFAGGMENGIVNLVNNSSDRFRHVVCCLRKKGDFARRLKRDTRVHELCMSQGNDYSLPYRILAVTRRERIGVVRAFNEDPYFYSFLGAKMTGRPILYYNGGRVLPEKRRRLFFERTFGNCASKVIVPSRGLKEYMVTKVGIMRDLIRVIHNGVDLKRFFKPKPMSEKRVELSIPAGDLVIGTVGRLVQQKDFPCFFEVARRLLAVRQNVSFIIVGDGPLKAELTALAARMGLGEKVKFLGIRQDIEDLYAVMDLFVLTTRREGMSNVVLEAMASKKVVIASDVEGIREVIHDGEDGFILKVGDVDGFVRTILSLEKNGREEIGEKALTRVKYHFSIERMVESYENLYLEVLGAGGNAAFRQ